MPALLLPAALCCRLSVRLALQPVCKRFRHVYWSEPALHESAAIYGIHRGRLAAMLSNLERIGRYVMEISFEEVNGAEPQFLQHLLPERLQHIVEYDEVPVALPPALPRFSRLISLHLDNKLTTSPLPGGTCPAIAQLGQLQALSIGTVQLPAELLSTILQLTQLESPDIASVWPLLVPRAIQQLTRLSQLEHLRLQTKHPAGMQPPEPARFASLTSFEFLCDGEGGDPAVDPGLLQVRCLGLPALQHQSA